jgi:predicted amidohydrolase
MNSPGPQPIFALQTDIVWENKAANHAAWERLLEQAQPPPGAIVVLPEVAASGFTQNLASSLEGPEKPSETACSCLARKWRIHLLCGMVRPAPDSRGFNQLVYFNPDGAETARYSKMQLFNLGGENQCHVPGDQIALTEINGIKTALFICYDLRFPELFREAVRRGAELFVVIANWPSKRADHWTTLLRARAIENQSWFVGVNRAGTDPFHSYPGRSLIVDCHGVVQADAGPDEGFVSAVMDPEAQRAWRREFPVLQDRRFGVVP